MIGWLTKRRAPDSPPPEPDEADRFYKLEQAVQEALRWANIELDDDPDNQHLEFARNYLSDAYICLWRASQKYHREAG